VEKLVAYLLQEPVRNLKTNARPCITAGTILVADAPSNPRLKPRRWRIFGAAVLIAALGLVVIYTSRGAFLSPVALVVVAAIGFAAVLMQLRLRQGPTAAGRAPWWLNVLGIIFALAAVFADVLRLNPSLTLVAALGAVLCFATSGVVVLAAMRKKRT
jgi:drug/metabolite transporter (DMT)-like permease